MGCTVPGISNLRALPSPSSNLWPQFLFDFDYNGNRGAAHINLSTCKQSFIHLEADGIMNMARALLKC